MLPESAGVVPGRFRNLWMQVHRRVTARRCVLWLLGAAVATLFLIPTLARLDLTTLAAELRAADGRWLAVALVANFLTLPLMTVQWRLLLPRGASARWRDLWPCVAIGMASMNVLPAGGGHAVATGLLASRRVTSIAGALSLLALEQLCEAAAKLGLVAVVIATVPVPAPLWRAAWITLGTGVLVATLAAWVAAQRRQRGERARWWHRWADHLQTLRSPGRFSLACAASVLMKVTAWIAVVAVQRSLGLQLSAGGTALVLAAVTFATMVAVSPGNVGFFELAAVAAYQWLGVSPSRAAVLAILVHLAFLVPIVGTGYAMAFGRAIASARASRRASA